MTADLQRLPSWRLVRNISGDALPKHDNEQESRRNHQSPNRGKGRPNDGKGLVQTAGAHLPAPQPIGTARSNLLRNTLLRLKTTRLRILNRDLVPNRHGRVLGNPRNRPPHEKNRRHQSRIFIQAQSVPNDSESHPCRSRPKVWPEGQKPRIRGTGYGNLQCLHRNKGHPNHEGLANPRGVLLR